jgi:hypothetical protein
LLLTGCTVDYIITMFIGGITAIERQYNRMSKYELIIGDNSINLAELASMMFKNNLLVTSDIFNQVDHLSVDCLYTSLADVTADQLVTLCKNAKDIHYFPPVTWDCNKLQTHTEEILTKIVAYYQIPIRNFVVPTDPTHSLTLMDCRKSELPQLWVAGCSYAYGFGLAQSQQRYIELISKKLEKSFSDLAAPGTSIDWAADQLLRSDIRPHDIVVWGITGINRVNYYIDNRSTDIARLKTAKMAKSPKKYFNKMITDDNRVNQSIKLMYQVKNFVDKIGAKLVLIFHRELSLHEHAKSFEHYLQTLDNYIAISVQQDFTDDNHPGPITNQVWAAEILEFLETHNHKS